MDLIYRYDPHQPIVVERPADAAEAVRKLIEGNRRLVGLVGRMQDATLGESTAGEMIIPMSPVSLGLPFWPGAALDQQPFAIVLGCSDARSPAELIFDQSFNELFVVRVAGNILGTEGLGSFDYAVRNLGHSVKAVIVLGHTGCGAVTAAVDTYLAPSEYANIAYTHALRSLVDRVMIAVRGAAKAIERRCGNEAKAHANYRMALVEVAVYLNAAITAFELRRQIASTGQHSLAVYHGVCDLKTMHVTTAPATAGPDLRPAPQAAEEFVELGDQFADALVSAGLFA